MRSSTSGFSSSSTASTPPEERWRPTLAFLLLFLAIYPALFPSAPRRLLILTAAYPLVAYWLIWGGAIWGPIGVLVGPALAWAALRLLPRLLRGWLDEGVRFLVSVAVGVLLAVSWWLFGVAEFDAALSAVADIGFVPVESARLGGFLLSMIIGVTGIAVRLPIGVCLALGRRSHLVVIRAFCVGVHRVHPRRAADHPPVRRFGPARLLPAPGTEFDLILRVVIMVTAFASAYMAEVIRGGLAALPRVSTRQRMRWVWTTGNPCG